MNRYRMIVTLKNNSIIMKTFRYDQFEKWYAENVTQIKEIKLVKIK